MVYFEHDFFSDVHNRDTVGKLVTSKVDHSSAFAWQAQLKHRWDFKQNSCFANICDAEFQYVRKLFDLVQKQQ